MNKERVQKGVTFCLHLAAFGCEQCKAIVQQEIDKERERCAKIVDRWHYKKGGYGVLADTLRGRDH